MGRRRLISLFASLLVAAAFAGGAAPAGVAQSNCIDPNYCPVEPTTGTGGGAGSTEGLTQSQLRKRCIAKAKKKFANNAAKKKAAIKKCKKKYPA
jgi:hypothetical protein